MVGCGIHSAVWSEKVDAAFLRLAGDIKQRGVRSMVTGNGGYILLYGLQWSYRVKRIGFFKGIPKRVASGVYTGKGEKDTATSWWDRERAKKQQQAGGIGTATSWRDMDRGKKQQQAGGIGGRAKEQQ